MGIAIEEKKYLGSGAHWQVFAITFAPPGHKIGKACVLRAAQKISRCGPLRIEDNVERYLKVKAAGIPTLNYFEAALIDGEQCILCEDLSLRERLYVSPNTVRQMPTTSSLLIKWMRPQNRSKSFKQIVDETPPPSRAETYLAKNRIARLTDFEELLHKMETLAIKAAHAGIIVCEDMFFFGTNRTKETSLDLIVADFDNAAIFPGDHSDHTQTEIMNKQMGLNAIWEFIDNFVEKGTEAVRYEERIGVAIRACQARMDELDDACS